MKKAMIKSAGVILLAMLMATSLNAQPNRQGGRAMAKGEGEGRFATLDLTEAQSEEITSLRTEHYKLMKPLRAQMAEIKAKERTLLSGESVDLKAVDKAIDQQTDLMNQMRKLQTKHQVAVKNVLSDEQVMKLELRQRHSARMGHGRMDHGRMGRGDGYGNGYGRGYPRGNDRPGRSI
jgi:Spy/CpxP family protein refolding chaperone